MSEKLPQLLREFYEIEYDRTMLTEAIAQEAPIRFPAILQRADAENQNGRVYPYEVLKRETDKYTEEFVKQQRALGELDHSNDSVVNLKNVSHNITELFWEGKTVRGIVEVLPTPAGNIVRDLMKANIRLGISSRGLGSVTQLNRDLVQVGDDFNLICWDIVSNPSTHGAFLNEHRRRTDVPTKTDRINNLIVDFFTELGK